MQFNELIAGFYLAFCILMALGCMYAAINKDRHPFTVITLAVLFALLLRQAWWVAFLPLSDSTVASTESEVTGGSTNNDESTANVLIKPGASTADWAQVWPNIARWQPEIEQAASQCGVDTALIAAVMRQESVGNPTICSKAGACGLMQLMPGTAADMNVQDRLDPEQSTRGGACYLRKMLDRYGNDTKLALAAYNAGPGNVDRYGGVPPFNETQLYIKNVLSFYQEIAIPTQQTSCCQWPVQGRITQQPSASHMALDIAATLGTPVVSAYGGEGAKGGKVIAVGWGGDYGKRVIIDHGNGLRTLYAHLSSFTVKEGDYVQPGTAIGRIGSTGRSTGPHLHFEIYQNGVLQNPWNYLSN